MFELFAILSPLFLLLALGAVLRRFWFKDDLWAALERLLFYVLFPVLIVHQLSRLRSVSEDQIWMCLSVLIASMAVAGLVFFAVRAGNVPGRSLTSILQGVARYNVFVALAAAQLVYGADGLMLSALLVAIMTPPNNFTSVWLLAKYGKADLERSVVMKRVLLNPNILACFLGLAIGFGGLQIPAMIDETLGMLAKATLPLSLLAVGAGIAWSMPSASWRMVAGTTLLKLLVIPAAALALGQFWGVSGMMLGVAVLYAATPAATSGYIMARQMGGDAELMANILSIETLCSVLTLPLWLYWVQNFAA